MIHVLQRFVNDEAGVDAVEYGIVAALIFLVIVAAVGAFANEAVSLFQDIANHV